MKVFAIGPLQGGIQSLQHLLNEIDFRDDKDILWFTGDLIANNESPLEVLRFVKSLGKQAITVLGDQEIYLLALAEGVITTSLDDKLNDVLNASDGKTLMQWLRQRPFLHYDATLNYTLVHAGIPAEWSFSQARTFAVEAETALAFGNAKTFLENYYETKLAKRWHAKLRGWKRTQVIANAFTRISHYNNKGHMKYIGASENMFDKEKDIPWYAMSDRGTAAQNIVFANSLMPMESKLPNIFPVEERNAQIQTLSALQLLPTPQKFSVDRVESKLSA